MGAAIAGYGEKELTLLLDFLTRAHKETVTAAAALQRNPPLEAKRGKRKPG